MTLKEAKDLALKQANELIVVKDDLSEDPGGDEYCAKLHSTTLHPDHHKDLWEIIGRREPR